MSSSSSSTPSASIPPNVIRVYVHSIGSSQFPAFPIHSHVFLCALGPTPPPPTIKQIKKAFREEILRAHFTKDVVKLPLMTQGVIRTTDGRQLADDSILTEVVQDREDLFMELKPTPASTTHQTAQTKTTTQAKSTPSSASASASSATTPSPTIQIRSGNGAPITIPRSQLGEMGAREHVIYQQLSTARDLQGKGHLKKAREIYKQVLESLKSADKSSESIQSCRQVCHQQLGVIYLFNRFYDEARTHFEMAIKIVTSATSGPNYDIVKGVGKTPQLELSQLNCLLGQCYFGLKDYSEAASHFERAVKLLTPKGEESKEAKIASAIEDTKVWLARSLYRGTPVERNQSLGMFESIIQKNEHHIAALTCYAQIAIECGKKFETIPYILRAIIASQAAGPRPPKGASAYDIEIQRQNSPDKDKEDETRGPDVDPQILELAQTLLTDLVSLPGGVKHLLSELHAAANNHSALSFLAQTVKDQGGIKAAIELYRHALDVCQLPPRPKSFLLLNLVHTMEVEYQYNEAFALIKQYLKENPDLTCGTLKVSEFYSAIQNITDLYDVNLRTGTAKGVPAYTAIGKIFDEGVCHVSVPQEAGAPPPTKHTAVPYPSDDLNIMALLFTTIKMLYICGGLQVLPTLINMLEPLRVDRQLHLTQIRNEHAYMSSIAQMLRHVPFPLPSELASAPVEDTVYVCGDSHSMSSAWQVLYLNSHPRPVLVYPKLVTGLKCWHLRPSSRFYPKRNFEAAMRTIPSKARIIFNFGEIDSREGLLVATEKGRYERIEDGINLAIDVYIKAMQEVQAKKQLQVFVHPITPTLDVTRPTVKLFNSALKERLKETAKLTPPIKYLDFFERMLTPDGNGFNMLYHLDATHLKPTYALDLMAPALDAAISGKKVVFPSDSPSHTMSTMDAINANLARAIGDFTDDAECDPNGMD